jgi:hypothetical protein
MSGQISIVKRNAIAGFAASDVFQGAPVKLAQNTTGDQSQWYFQMCQSSADKPVGIAHDNAIAGDALSVFDDMNIVRAMVTPNLYGLGASVTRTNYVGVVGTSTAVHPESGATVTFPLLGQVSSSPSVAVGASTAPVWAVGAAYENGAVGDRAGYRIEPRLLSGWVNS